MIKINAKISISLCLILLVTFLELNAVFIKLSANKNKMLNMKLCVCSIVQVFKRENSMNYENGKQQYRKLADQSNLLLFFF